MKVLKMEINNSPQPLQIMNISSEDGTLYITEMAIEKLQQARLLS